MQSEQLEAPDTFTRDQFPDLQADFILANPPFNISDWCHASLTGDARWGYGDPARWQRQQRGAAARLLHLNLG